MMVNLLVGALLSVTAETQQRTPPEVVVLGVRQGARILGDGFAVEPPEAINTFLVDKRGFADVGHGLHVPRADGWYRITQERVARGDFSYETLVVWPTGTRKPGLPYPVDRDAFDDCPGPGDGCFMRSGFTVLFVGKDHIAVIDSDHWRGGGDPSHLNILATRPLRSTPSYGKSGPPRGLPIGGVLGQKTAGVFERAAKQAASEYVDSRILESSWGLIRSDGRWAVRGAVMLSNSSGAVTEFFTLPRAVAPAFTSHDSLPASWADMIAEHPGLDDVVASPTGRLQVLVFPDRLEAWFDGRLVDTRKAEDRAIVMAQWASGSDEIRAWQRALRELPRP